MTLTAEQETAFAGPGALAALVRAGEAHPRELIELCLARIESLDSATSAFRVTLAEPWLAQADALAADSALTHSELPLAGVPIAVKDDIAVAGQPTTKGSRSYGPPPSAYAEAIRRLRAAGAIPIGITNVPELTIFPWAATAANGVTRNPWDLTRPPGGSSGGSAAAAASGMVPVATGLDGGGSIRIPAACWGLVGMKATRGRVSMAPAAEGGWLGLSVYGALARTVADSALMLDVMSGSALAESYVEPAARAPGRLRIAISAKGAPRPGCAGSTRSHARSPTRLGWSPRRDRWPPVGAGSCLRAGAPGCWASEPARAPGSWRCGASSTSC